jgi:uncharacterized membrane protein
MSSEPKGAIVTVILMILTFVFPRARVLTVPFFFVLLLVLIFWAARVAADRADREEER